MDPFCKGTFQTRFHVGTYESVQPGVLPVQGLVDPDDPRGLFDGEVVLLVAGEDGVGDQTALGVPRHQARHRRVPRSALAHLVEEVAQRSV